MTFRGYFFKPGSSSDSKAGIGFKGLEIPRALCSGSGGKDGLVTYAPVCRGGTSCAVSDVACDLLRILHQEWWQSEDSVEGGKGIPPLEGLDRARVKANSAHPRQEAYRQSQKPHSAVATNGLRLSNLKRLFTVVSAASSRQWPNYQSDFDKKDSAAVWAL